MIPTWSSVVTTTPIPYPLPIGEARVRTAHEGVVPTVGFSHNNSFSIPIYQPFYRATDVNHFVRFIGGSLRTNMYLDIKVQLTPCVDGFST